MNRQAQGVVMFLLGAAVLRASMTNLYLRYVKAGLRPFLLLAGVLLIVAAAATFWYELRRMLAHRRAVRAGQEYQHEHGQAHEHGHAADGGHPHREPRVAWLMVLPVLALILVVPPALGSYAADRTGTALQPRFGIPAVPAGDPVTLTLLDYATLAAFDHGRSLGGRHVTISGFITVGPRGVPVLTRMILNCCAADAQPIKVGLSGQVPFGLQPDQWVQVTGTYTSRQSRDGVNGGPIPFLDVSQARQIPAPADPYET